MSRWRVATVVILWIAPFAVLAGLGGYHLWQRGWSLYAALPIALCIGLAYALAWYWHRQKRLLPGWSFEPIPHGSQRDQEAWKLIVRRVKEAESLPATRFTEPGVYSKSGQELALELARFYHPGADDPYSMLTLPELLAVAELAARDLSELVERYIPGSHILTVDDYKKARQAVDWYRRANNLYWVASAIYSPIETAARYLAARVASGGTWNLLQNNVLVWFYTAFLHRLGHYLIELHSGRLRVGASRYRQLAAAASPGAPREASVGQVTVTLLGQVKAGKSSLINDLLGQQRAPTNVLPETDAITRYEMVLEDVPTRFVLLDTPGYGHEGPRADQLKATVEAARRSHLIVLVLHARNPARKADLEALQALQRWFTEHPDLKMPPVVAVLTHIDLLSPMMEWATPYDWQEPQRPKEHQIAEAVAVAQETLGNRVNYVAPVCTAEGKVYGVEDWLLPALLSQLDEAHGVELVRLLRAEADAGKVQRVFQQLYAVGKQAVNVLRERSRK